MRHHEVLKQISVSHIKKQGLRPRVVILQGLEARSFHFAMSTNWWLEQSSWLQ